MCVFSLPLMCRLEYVLYRWFKRGVSKEKWRVRKIENFPLRIFLTCSFWISGFSCDFILSLTFLRFVRENFNVTKENFGHRYEIELMMINGKTKSRVWWENNSIIIFIVNDDHYLTHPRSSHPTIFIHLRYIFLLNASR